MSVIALFNVMYDVLQLRLHLISNDSWCLSFGFAQDHGHAASIQDAYKVALFYLARYEAKSTNLRPSQSAIPDRGLDSATELSDNRVSFVFN